MIRSNHTQEHSSSSVDWSSSTLFFFFQPKQDPTSFSFFLLILSLFFFSSNLFFQTPFLLPTHPTLLSSKSLSLIFSFSHLSESSSFSLENVLPSSLKSVSSDSYQTPPMPFHLFSSLLSLPLNAIFHALLRKHQPHLFLFPCSLPTPEFSF